SHASLCSPSYGDLRDLHSFPTRRSSDLDDIDQAVGAQPVGAMNADAGALAGGEKARHTRVLVVEDDLGVVVRRDTTHGIVGGRMGRNQLALRFQTLIDAHEVGDIGDLLVEHLAAQVAQVQVHVVFAADA